MTLLPLRLPLISALLLALLAACAPTTDELLPIPASIKGSSMVSEVEVVVSRAAAATVDRLNGKVEGKPIPAGARQPFEEMLAQTIRDVTRERGLTSGRPLKLRVEIEELQTANAASAVIGRDDRLEGSVYVRDAATGEGLGQLYITIENHNGGLISAVLRLRGVREQLAARFAEDIAEALGAPGSTRR